MDKKLFVFVIISLITGVVLGYGVSYVIYQQDILELRMKVLELQFENSESNNALQSLQTNYSLLESNYSSLEQTYQSLLNNYTSSKTFETNFTSLLDNYTFLIITKMRSGSMEPTLKIGDLLIIQGITGESIYAHSSDGDIIFFHDPRNYSGIPIVHRSVDKYEVDGTWYIVTKGDNNPTVDDWSWYGYPKGGIYNVAGVPDSYIIGKVIIIIPNN